MTERSDDRSFDALEADLRRLAGALAYPQPGPGFASAVAGSIAARPQMSWWDRLGWPRQTRGPVVRRSVLIAVALLLFTVAIAAAMVFGVPGIRILFGPPSSPSPSGPGPTAPADGLPTFLPIFLGDRVETAEVEGLVGFGPRLPADPAVGPADRVYVDDGRVTLVWQTSPAIPETESRGIGLLITEFRGDVDPGWYEKLLHTGATTIEHIEVDGHAGYWIEGEPHGLAYNKPDGDRVDETRRIVGDVLIWNDGELTYRLETSLGREAAIRIAESLE